MYTTGFPVYGYTKWQTSHDTELYKLFLCEVFPFFLPSVGGCCLHQFLVFLVSGLLLWRTGHCQGTGAVNGFINFAQSSLTVDEGSSSQTFTTVSIPLVREGGTTGNVFVTITVSCTNNFVMCIIYCIFVILHM
jgi:hypothetical protein